MAQKQRRPPLDEPPTASSSDSEDDHQRASQHQDKEEDDEETSSDEATSSEEDDDDEQQHCIQPSLQLSSKISPPAPSISHPKPSSDNSATESDAGSDSESEPDPPVPNPKVKPLASKPMENNTPKVKALPSPAAPPRSGSKRSVENNAHVPDPKRAKKVTSVSASAGSDEENEDGKKLGEDPKPLFQRVFSEEDVIAILKGIVDFTSKTGLDPYKNADQFYDFVKKSLHSGANSNQVKEKIRRLKKKFEVNLGKGKNGEDPTFSKPHEQESFELSKKIWSGEAVEKGKPNGKPAKTPKKEVNNKNVASDKKLKPETKALAEVQSEDLKEPEKKEVDLKRDDSTLLLSEMLSFEKGIGLSGLLNEDAVKRGLDLIGASKRAELEGRWKELHISSLELLEKRAQLIHDQAGLILEAYKLSNH